MFVSFKETPLLTREQWMKTFYDVATELGIINVKGACVCAAMCAFQEAGGDPHNTGKRQIWIPGNISDPCFWRDSDAYPHDSMSNDGLSVGPFQQQTSRPGVTPAWGWGGLYDDPEGTRRRMDPVESTRMFLDALVDSGINAIDRYSANNSIQRVQKSGAPLAYQQWWDEANALYDQVIAKGSGGTIVSAASTTTTGWTGDPVWLLDQLEKEVGAKRVRALDGWDKRGHGDFKDIRGVMVHHTGNGRATPESIRDGRPDLPGPVSQIYIAQDGTVTVVAVGVAWHAGVGSLPWVPANMGNWHLIGMECAWPMDTSITEATQLREKWPDAEVIAIRDTVAAILKRLVYGSDRCTTHKEYAGQAQGKWDPGNMDPGWLRGEVAKDLAGVKFPGEGDEVYTPAPVPAPTPPVNQYAGILLYRGMTGLPVVKLQTALKRYLSKLVVDGVYGPATEDAVRWYQSQPYRRPPLDPDGIVGPATAAQLGLVI